MSAAHFQSVHPPILKKHTGGPMYIPKRWCSSRGNGSSTLFYGETSENYVTRCWMNSDTQYMAWSCRLPVFTVTFQSNWLNAFRQVGLWILWTYSQFNW